MTKPKSATSTTPDIEAQLDDAFRRGYEQAMKEAQQIVAEVLGGKQDKRADRQCATD